VWQVVSEPDIDTHALLKAETLSKLAQHYPDVPANSAPVERLFSIEGRMSCSDRCHLIDKTFENLMNGLLST